MNLVKKLAVEAEQRKEEIESARNIPEDIMERIKAASLVKMWAPKQYGGLELSVMEATQMLQEISYHNASLSWVVGVTGCSSLFSGFLEKQQATLLFNDDHAMVGGFAGPAGMAIQVEDGLQVSGSWSWGSGITHCSHIVGGVMVFDGDQMKGSAIAFFLPEEVDMIDNWHVVGLKGTHSIDYKVDQLTIPEKRWSWFPLAEPNQEAALYRFSFLGALSLTIASVGLGIAKRAVDEITALSAQKSPYGQGKPLSKRPEYQIDIASIHADYLSAEALFNHVIIEAEQETALGKCSQQMKAKIRLAAAHTAHLSHQVVQAAYRMGGGSSIWENHKLEELLRDMNVVSQHGMVAKSNYRTAGAVFTGNQVPEFLL